MGKIIALGGGCFGNTEMHNVVKYMIELTGKKNPLVLYIPTACHDNCTPDDETIVCFESFGCRTDVLFLTHGETTEKVMAEKIDSCDMIYVFGGNLKFLSDTWKKSGVNKYLLKAYDEGKLLSGVSSGSMCWFKEGYDDCGENGSFMFVDALGIIPYINCPHYQSENWQTFGEAIKTKSISGIALDNGAGLCYIDGKYSTISGNEGGDCYFYDAEDNYKKTTLNGNKELLSRL